MQTSKIVIGQDYGIQLYEGHEPYRATVIATKVRREFYGSGRGFIKRIAHDGVEIQTTASDGTLTRRIVIPRKVTAPWAEQEATNVTRDNVRRKREEAKVERDTQRQIAMATANDYLPYDMQLKSWDVTKYGKITLTVEQLEVLVGQLENK